MWIIASLIIPIILAYIKREDIASFLEGNHQLKLKN